MLSDSGPDPFSNLLRRPVYLQLRDAYLERIRSGEWRAQRPLPNEVELASESQVSVGTVRKAIDELAQLGVVTRQQGRGTFVSETSSARCGLFDPIRNPDGSSIQWDPPRQLATETGSLTPEEAGRLGRSHRSDALRLTWLHKKSNKAFSLQRSVVPLDTGIDVKRPHHSAGLGDLFSEARILVVRSEDRLTIAVPDPETAKHLQITDKRSLQHVSRRYFDTQDTVVGLCSSWLVMEGEQYVCTQMLRR